jgi:hypothetical protein
MANESPSNPPLEVEEEEGAYISSEDEDFHPESIGIVAQDHSSSSSSESEAETKSGTKKGTKIQKESYKKRKRDTAPRDDLDFENSGDEGIIKEGEKQERRRKRRKDTKQHEDEESGGEGGLVQTRSMRAAT